VRGSFRRDLELVPSAFGEFRLRRKRGARLLNVGLALAGLFTTLMDYRTGRTWFAAAQLAMTVAFVALLLRAELDSWRFDGGQAVRRTFRFAALRFEEVRLDAKQIASVAVRRGGARAQAWIETRSGERYALVEGKVAEVDPIVQRLSAAVELANLDRTTVH
jgi:hypothetical protein